MLFYWNYCFDALSFSTSTRDKYPDIHCNRWYFETKSRQFAFCRKDKTKFCTKNHKHTETIDLHTEKYYAKSLCAQWGSDNRWQTFAGTTYWFSAAYNSGRTSIRELSSFRQIKLYEYYDVSAAHRRQLSEKKTHLFKCLSISVCMRELTPAKNWRSTMKKSFPLIDMSKLVICKRRSCFAKCNFWLSPIQNVSRSIDVTNFVFYKTTNVFRNLIRRIEGKNWCYLNDKVVTCIN